MTKFMKIRLFVLQFCVTTIFLRAATAARETPEPAAFLQPRHFNPHPYENGRRIAPGLVKKLVPNNVYNPGPVRFPSNDDNVLIRGEIQHPYAKLKQKQVEQPRKQHYPRARHHDDDETSTSKKHYAFSYTVRDKQSGDDFSHSQQQTGGAVHGSYKVQLPDGRIQTVKYTADNNGYRADVSYNVIDDHHSNNIRPTHYQDYRQAPVLQKPIVVESPSPLSTPQEVLIPPAPQHHYISKPYMSDALISAQPIYNYYKDLQAYGKPYYQTNSYQNSDHNNYDYQQNHVPILSTPSTPISNTIKYPSPSSPSSSAIQTHNNYPHKYDVQHIDINNYNAAQSGHTQIYSTIPTPYARGSKPGLVAKIVSTTVRPPYEDITVIPVSKYHHSPTAATYTSTPSYDSYQQRKNTVLPTYEGLLNDNGNDHQHDYRSSISSTVATNLLKPNDDYYYK